MNKFEATLKEQALLTEIINISGQMDFQERAEAFAKLLYVSCMAFGCDIELECKNNKNFVSIRDKNQNPTIYSLNKDNQYMGSISLSEMDEVLGEWVKAQIENHNKSKNKLELCLMDCLLGEWVKAQIETGQIPSKRRCEIFANITKELTNTFECEITIKWETKQFKDCSIVNIQAIDAETGEVQASLELKT